MIADRPPRPAIAIIDYGVGNLASVRKALRAVGADAELVGDPARLVEATAIVLPGVGNFAHCSREFHRAGFAPHVRRARDAGVPVLGICVGMQLFFGASEESADEPGIGLLPGRVARLRGVTRVPQIGWNEVRLHRRHPWLAGVPDRFWSYFVHSYAADPDPAHLIGTVEYGGERAAIVGDDGLLGVQFHPEKSGSAGLALLRSFARAVA